MSHGTTKGVPIDVDTTLSQNSDQLVPSQKAVKAYIDGSLGTSWSEAVRDASGITTAGYKAYNTDKDRWEFYDPFWGWRPLSIDGSSRDWGFESLHDLNAPGSNGTILVATIGTGTITAFATTTETGLSLGTGTTDAVSGYYAYGSVSSVVFGLNIYRFESRLLIPTLATAGENFVVKNGFYDGFNTANTTDGAYFLADTQGTSTGSAASGNWQIVTTSNSVRTFTTTSIAISTTTYSKFRIDVNAAGTSVKFYIDNTLVGTHTTNIPTGSARATGAGAMILKSVGTSARTVNVDYLYYAMKFTTPR